MNRWTAVAELVVPFFRSVGRRGRDNTSQHPEVVRVDACVISIVVQCTYNWDHKLVHMVTEPLGHIMSLWQTMNSAVKGIAVSDFLPYSHGAL